MARRGGRARRRHHSRSRHVGAHRSRAPRRIHRASAALRGVGIRHIGTSGNTHHRTVHSMPSRVVGTQLHIRSNNVICARILGVALLFVGLGMVTAAAVTHNLVMIGPGAFLIFVGVVVNCMVALRRTQPEAFHGAMTSTGALTQPNIAPVSGHILNETSIDTSQTQVSGFVAPPDIPMTVLQPYPPTAASNAAIGSMDYANGVVTRTPSTIIFYNAPTSYDASMHTQPHALPTSIPNPQSTFSNIPSYSSAVDAPLPTTGTTPLQGQSNDEPPPPSYESAVAMGGGQPPV